MEKMFKRKVEAAQSETPKKKTKLLQKVKQNPRGPKKFSKKDKPPQKFENVNKGKFGKPKNGTNETSKPANWNEFKMKKKELRLKRKQNKSLFEIVAKAKKIGETLRRKNLKDGEQERDKLVNQLHGMLGGHGNYVKLVLTHDMARIIQYMLKFGNEKIKEEIALEIIPSTIELLQSKYGRYCIKPLFKYGSTKTRSCAIKAIYGNAVKVATHFISASVFEYIYSTWAQPIEKMHFIQEFFGDLYKQSKDNNIKHLRDVYANSPEMKDAALGATKANLSKALNKNLLDSGLIQSVLYQYISECNENDRNELISQISQHSVILSNSKDGSRTVMECIWCGTAKDRKVIMKLLKEHVLELCKHEHGHTVLIALLDAIDDTVLVNKLIVSEILKNTLDLARNEWGRKIILWLVAPAHSTHFHPTFVNELEYGRQKSTCKKSPELRRKEILQYSSDILLTSVNTETRFWFESGSLSVAALAILKTGQGTLLSETLSNVTKIIISDNWKIKENEEDVLGVEHAALHMTLKKLIQNDKNAIKEGKPAFSEILVQHLDDKVIKTWLKMNRSCFLFVLMLENGNEDVVSNLQEKLNKHISIIKKQKTAGSRILLKKLSELLKE